MQLCPCEPNRAAFGPWIGKSLILFELASQIKYLQWLSQERNILFLHEWVGVGQSNSRIFVFQHTLVRMSTLSRMRRLVMCFTEELWMNDPKSGNWNKQSSNPIPFADQCFWLARYLPSSYYFWSRIWWCSLLKIMFHPGVGQGSWCLTCPA